MPLNAGWGGRGVNEVCEVGGTLVRRDEGVQLVGKQVLWNGHFASTRLFLHILLFDDYNRIGWFWSQTLRTVRLKIILKGWRQMNSIPICIQFAKIILWQNHLQVSIWVSLMISDFCYNASGQALLHFKHTWRGRKMSRSLPGGSDARKSQDSARFQKRTAPLVHTQRGAWRRRALRVCWEKLHSDNLTHRKQLHWREKCLLLTASCKLLQP